MSTTVPLYGFGGGGGTGGTLTVTAPAGVSVTVSKDGKSKSKVAGADGIAVFKGLATGAWTVTITDGSQTASGIVTVTADYSVAIAFFAATISVEYPAGSACTATAGTTTLSAPDTSGAWACVVPNTGTWTFSCTDGEQETSAAVEITEDGQSKSVTLSYWNGELYDAGNLYESITGGWTTDETSKIPTITYDEATMTIAATASGSNKIVRTAQMIDMTSWDTLHFEGTHANAGSFNLMGVLDASKTSVASVILANGHDLDISSLSGSYYVYFQVRDADKKTVVSRLYLE